MSAIQEVHQLKAQVKVFQQEAAVLRLRVAELEIRLYSMEMSRDHYKELWLKAEMKSEHGSD